MLSIFHSGCIDLHFHQQYMSFGCSTFLLALSVVSLLSFSHLGNVLQHLILVLICIFWWLMRLRSFNFINHLDNFSCKLSLEVSCRLFYWVIFLKNWFMEILYKLSLHELQISFPTLWLTFFHSLNGIFWWIEVFFYFNPVFKIISFAILSVYLSLCLIWKY